MQALLNLFSPSFFFFPFSFGAAFFIFLHLFAFCVTLFLSFFIITECAARQVLVDLLPSMHQAANLLFFLDSQNLSANQSKTRMRG